MRFEVRTNASPEQVSRALTDFTDRRPRIWRRTLDATTYELIEQGEDWAVARESSPGSPFWVVARYDWSDPAMVRWKVTDSSYGGGGGGSIRISPARDGGSHLHTEWTNTGATAQRPLLFLLHHGPMGRLIARRWTSTLNRYAAEDPNRPGEEKS